MSTPFKAEEAFSDLHVLAAIEVVATSNILRTSVGRTAARKIAIICKEAQQRSLAGYDRARVSQETERG